MTKLLTKSKDFNDSYLAKVIQITNIVKHPNADKLNISNIDGKSIITNLTTKEGDIRILFPIESAINLEYLAENNNFRPKLNMNKDEKFNEITNPDIKGGGFFEAKGRVRAIKLCGLLSEGYLVPVETLSFMLSPKEIDEIKNSIGTEFNMIKDFQLCKKYVIKETRQKGLGNKQSKKPIESKIIPDQFRFHSDTAQLSKNIWKIKPYSFVTISDKWHGCNFVVGKLLCKKPLKWYEKIIKKLGINVVNTHYDLIYSSRRVIKNAELNPNAVHYYKIDIWGKAAKRIEPFLLKGETLYGELVGYVESDKAIQSMNGKPYDYGTQPGEFKIVIFRITQTNVDGKVFELSTQQMIERCDLMGLQTVPILYSGYAKDKYPELKINEHWNENFLENLKNEYLEQKCKFCQSDVWAEGIVIRIEGLVPEALKLKSKNFLLGETEELDKGIIDIESAESMDEAIEEEL